MKKKIREMERDEILAIIPVYVRNYGNSTLVYTSKRKVFVKKTVKTVMNNLCRYHNFDMKASNEKYRKWLSIGLNVPVPITDKDTYIPIRTRVPIAKNDGAYGYVNLRGIRSIEFYNEEMDGDRFHAYDKREHSWIRLRNGSTIKVLNRYNVLNKAVQQGNIVSLLRKKNPFINDYDYICEDGQSESLDNYSMDLVAEESITYEEVSKTIKFLGLVLEKMKED